MVVRDARQVHVMRTRARTFEARERRRTDQQGMAIVDMVGAHRCFVRVPLELDGDVVVDGRQ